MAEPLYLRPPYVYLFFGAALVIGIREVIVRRYLRVDPEFVVDAGSFRVLWGSTTVATALALFVPFSGIGTVPDPLASFWIGLATMFVGFLVRMYAVVTLGELFSHCVAVNPDHEVVDSGPYAWVRHPSYTGAVVTYLGIGVVCGNWISVAAEAVGAAVGYGYRIRVEEATLREHLDSYAEYADRVPYRLIPFVW